MTLASGLQVTFECHLTIATGRSSDAQLCGHNFGTYRLSLDHFDAIRACCETEGAHSGFWRVRSWMFKERQIEGRKHQDNSDVY